MPASDPLAQIQRLASRCASDRARASIGLAAASHLALALWASGWTPHFPPSAWAEIEPIAVSIEPVSGDWTLPGDPGGPSGSEGPSASLAPRSALPSNNPSAPAAPSPPRDPRPTPRPAAADDDPPDALDGAFASWMLRLHAEAHASPAGQAAQRTSGGGPDAPGTSAGRGAGSDARPGSGTSSGPGTGHTGKARGASFLPDWDCTFPARNPGGVVRIVVTVRPDGAAASTEVISDPGHGLASIARECAARQRFVPARDARGLPVAGKTEPFNVRFIH